MTATAAVRPVHDRGVDAALARARRGVRRLDALETAQALSDRALVIDTRTESQRARDGELPGAIVIDRTVLEWRLDPSSPDHIPEATSYDVQVVVVCRQGYSSSFAAENLRSIGLHRATDLVGGFEAWIAAGLERGAGPGDVRV